MDFGINVRPASLRYGPLVATRTAEYDRIGFAFSVPSISDREAFVEPQGL
jgi:hypothetical protein